MGTQSFLDNSCCFSISTRKFLGYFGVRKHATKEFGVMITGLKGQVVFRHELATRGICKLAFKIKNSSFNKSISRIHLRLPGTWCFQNDAQLSFTQSWQVQFGFGPPNFTVSRTLINHEQNEKTLHTLLISFTSP